MPPRNVNPKKRTRRSEITVEKDLPKKINPRSLKIKEIFPKNERQENAFVSLEENIITFLQGEAGTGKTFLAVYQALWALKEDEVDKIVICRPAVDAGESLGFLPGDFSEKVSPYMRPIYNYMEELIGLHAFEALKECKYIEVLPFAYMRGVTLSRCFIIFDETQNATKSQLKMALTRIGEGSIVAVTADPTQIDLKSQVDSAVNDFFRFKNAKGIGFIEFTDEDVVRSKIVKKILECYKDTSK